MAVIFKPAASAWQNERYSISEDGVINSSADDTCLSCRIATSDLEEGSKVVFPQSSGNITVSVFLETDGGTGIELLSARSVSLGEVTQALPSGFIQDYATLIIMLDGNGSQSTISIYSAQVFINITDMYFRRSELLQWVTPVQLQEFEELYPNIVRNAYNTALANVYAQIGNYYDIKDLLSITDEEEKDQTLLWILKVFTAYNVCAPAVQISEPLRANFEQANITLKELKGGQVSMENSASKLQEDGTKGVLVSINKQYRG